MAQIHTKKIKNGESLSIRYRMQGVTKEFFLGSRYTRKYAEEIAEYIDQLIYCMETGALPRRSLLGWLEDMGEDLRTRFERNGLIESKKRINVTELFDAYFQAEEGRVKPSTERNHETNRNRFVCFFGSDTLVDTITPVQANEYRRWLGTTGSRIDGKQKPYAQATISGAIKDAKAIFNWAKKRQFVNESPFAEMKKGSFQNDERKFFVSLDWYYRLLEYCPDQEWRTLLALARIGGLRNPSEVTGVKWTDIDWNTDTLRVYSIKNERFENKRERLIPLWQDLRKELLALQKLGVQSDGPYIISRYRGKENNRTQFQRIVAQAGFQCWERIFQNLRSSREKELEQAGFPLSQVAYWLGNSAIVAANHYCHVTKSDVKEAIHKESKLLTDQV